MELVFIHGWGFDAHFWDTLCEHLSPYKQQRIDLGFYKQSHSGSNEIPLPLREGLGEGYKNLTPSPNLRKILIGHSLGFIHGLRQKQDWSGWVAINSFPRFVRTPSQAGCVTASELRAMRMMLGIDAARTLRSFYQRIGAKPPEVSPDIERLCAGLNELRDADVNGIPELSDTPGIILASRNDPLVPVETSEALSGITQKSRLLWHETGGHILPVNDPVWCAGAIRDFVETHFG